jgi:hypothetical protein
MFAIVTVLAAAVVDLFRWRRSLLALLRHQLTVLHRSVARPRVTRLDRVVLVALAAITPTWRNVLRVVQPETLLRWHRAPGPTAPAPESLEARGGVTEILEMPNRGHTLTIDGG